MGELAAIWDITLQEGSTDVKTLIDTDEDGVATDFTGSVMTARVAVGYDTEAVFEISSDAGEIVFPGSGEVEFIFSVVNIDSLSELTNLRLQADNIPSCGVSVRYLVGRVVF